MKIFIERIENADTWDTELEEFGGSIFMIRKWLEAICCNGKKPVF